MVNKPTKEDKENVKKEIFDLAEKYKEPSIANSIRLNKAFVGGLFPKLVKKYGAYEAGLMFKDIHDEIERRNKVKNKKKKGVVE